MIILKYASWIFTMIIIYPDLIVTNSDLFCKELINYNQTRSKIIALKSQRYARFYASLNYYALNKSSDKILVLFPLIEEEYFLSS